MSLPKTKLSPAGLLSTTVVLERNAGAYKLTTGIDSNWQPVWLRFGDEIGRIGYQRILDALPQPSDHSFLGCHQNWPDRDEFSGDLSALRGFAETVFSGRTWAFSTRRFDELIIGANVGPILVATGNEIHDEYASPFVTDRR